MTAAIADARAHGDLKENAEYHAAREQQSFIEGRINEIESKLSNAQVIDIGTMPQNGRVIFGTTVTLTHHTEASEVMYQIVGEDEADVSLHKIACTTPISRALMGKQVGDDVEVRIPGGVVGYTIVKVEYL